MVPRNLPPRRLGTIRHYVKDDKDGCRERCGSVHADVCKPRSVASLAGMSKMNRRRGGDASHNVFNLYINEERPAFRRRTAISHRESARSRWRHASSNPGQLPTAFPTLSSDDTAPFDLFQCRRGANGSRFASELPYRAAGRARSSYRSCRASNKMRRRVAILGCLQVGWINGQHLDPRSALRRHEDHRRKTTIGCKR
jgi:hypothetical protein